MNNSIEKNSIIKRKELDERCYFNSLINQAYEIGVIEEDTISNIQAQLLQLLEQRVSKFNGFDNSSILTDKASIIMESNIYTIGIYLKKFIPDVAIQELKDKNIIDIYNNGKKIINRKLDISRVLYKKVLNNKVDIENDVYNATIIEGITGFFKIYDPDFNAQDIKITADYPLYNNLIGKLDGIEFIEKYLQFINYENQFCNMFKIDSMRVLLYNYKELVINIFQIVLTEVIGLELANEDITKLAITKNGIYEIYDEMDGKNKIEIYEILEQSYNKLKKNLLKNNKELQGYIEKGFSQIQYDIYNAIKTKTLDKLLICEKFITG